MTELSLVTGAGGFIGGHLVKELLAKGHAVRAVDIKPEAEWHQVFADADNRIADLREASACADAVAGVADVYNLASDMGGMGFIESHKAACMLSVLINTHLLQASAAADVERYFFGSSACVYAEEHQTSPDVTPLREEDAYPAMPEDGYGWEKLFSERMCRHFTEDFGLTTRVARYHNVYGPHGTFDGGREKAPAAICRKVAEAELFDRADIEIWGDGKQTRSFTYIDDCIHGTLAIMDSGITEPVNLGSSTLVTIDDLVSIVEEIAGVTLERRYRTDAPTGVRGRNSDNTKLKAALGWEPSTTLRDGLDVTYQWVRDQVREGRPVALS
ncbi:MAG TPA: NAD-dependent epimerase/dehydratase family protein [Thermoleophilaceae bacterium]|nr:NAD-dependent epimerase/dehydratase family protein [Thermoleophilaceae bacterium]